MIINNLGEIWIELTMIPFLLVMSVFLSGRMATTSEINKRFVRLVISTLAAACLEAYLELFGDMNGTTIYTKIFYALIVINAYCLMTYVAAYTRSNSPRLIGINFFLLSIAITLLLITNPDLLYCSLLKALYCNSSTRNITATDNSS